MAQQPQQEIPPLGKAFFLEYSNNDTGFPVVGITRHPNEGKGMAPPAIGDACPDPRYSATHVLCDYKVLSPDQRVTEIYQILPGPVVTETKIDLETNTPVTTVVQEIRTGSEEPSLDISGDGTTLTKVEIRRLNDAKSLKTTTISVIPNGVTAGSPSDSPFPKTTSTKVDEEAQGSTTVQTIQPVDPATLPDAGGYKVLESEVVAINQFISKKVRKELAQGEEFPELAEFIVDDQTKITIEVLKKIVPASEATSLNAGYHAPYYIEYKPLNKFRCVRIKSKAVTSTLPAAETFYGEENYAFENVLEEIGIVWSQSKNKGGGASNVVPGASIPVDWRWTCLAETNAQAGLSASVYAKIKDGYRGPCKTRTVRRFKFGPPTTDDLAAPTIVTPVRGTVNIFSSAISNNNSLSYDGQGIEAYTTQARAGGGMQAQSSEVQIGPFLHNGVTLQNATAPVTTEYITATSGSIPSGGYFPASTSTATASGSAYLSLPASTTVPGSGTELCLGTRSQRYKLGLWILDTVYVYHP